MDNAILNVTKKEFYTVAMNICLLIFFTSLMADKEGFGKVYIAIWALGLQMYCLYKLRLAKSQEKQIALEEGNL
jgi:hypothetical protein